MSHVQIVSGAYHKYEDMIALGAYKEGSNPKVDYALSMIEKLNRYLRQGMNEHRDLGDSIQGLYCIFEEMSGD